MIRTITYPHSNLFPLSFSEGFLQYVNQNFGGKITYFESGEIIYPVLIKSTFGFKIGVSVAVPLKRGKRLSMDEEVKFMSELRDYLLKNKLVDFIYPPIHLDNFNHLPTGAIGSELGIITLLLDDSSKEELFQEMKPVYRRHIRSAIKEGITVEFGLKNFEDFYEIYSTKLVAENAPYDEKNTIINLINNSKHDFEVQCAVAYNKGVPEAGILNLSDDKMAYYFYGGAKKGAHNGSFRLLHWELIQYYKEQGLKAYQLGGYRSGANLTDKHQRLADFKIGFGADVVEGFHFTWVLSPLKYRLYQFFVAMKSKLSR